VNASDRERESKNPYQRHRSCANNLIGAHNGCHSESPRSGGEEPALSTCGVIGIIAPASLQKEIQQSGQRQATDYENQAR
jgi:hypothetical protein